MPFDSVVHEYLYTNILSAGWFKIKRNNTIFLQQSNHWLYQK